MRAVFAALATLRDWFREDFTPRRGDAKMNEHVIGKKG
jgi:hypothetical protein